jgi:hypothetical protein
MGTGCRVSPCTVEVLVACPKPCEPRAGIVAEAPAQGLRLSHRNRKPTAVYTTGHTISSIPSSMPFEHDHPRYGGRTAGTSNKPKPTLLEMLAQRYPNFHPILAMLEMYHDPETPVELRARLLNDIASYTVPRIKPIADIPHTHPLDLRIKCLIRGSQ